MPREADPFRNYVEFQRNNKWKCKFCKKEYAGSATRIKAHLAGVGGYGINDCKDVDGQVRSEALKVLKVKTLVKLSNRQGNVEEAPHQLVIASNEDGRRETSLAAMPCPNSVISTVGASSSDFLPSYEMNMPSQYLPTQNMITHGDFSFWTQPPQSHAGVSNIQPLNLSYPSDSVDLAPEALTNMPRPLNAEEGEPNTGLTQDARTYDAPEDSQPGTRTCGLVNQNKPTLKRKLEELISREAEMDELETWCRKAKRTKVEYWSMVQSFREGRSLSPQQVERVDDLSKEVEEILGHCSFRKGSTTYAAGCRKSSPFVIPELVGYESKKIKVICDYLMEEKIFIIGIWGMGGVGKTAILMHVYNRVLKNPAFNDVFWVTVPQEFHVYELQDKIANAVSLVNLPKDKDVKMRACILNGHLEKKKAVLILDGLWTYFNFVDLGIPVGKEGIKLVLTTRSLNVCHKMLCQKQIKIEPLRSPDDLSLFRKKLDFGRELPSEEIASSIVDKCGGLPLGIIEIATHMRGVEQLHEWKDMLRGLEDSMVKLDIFKRLELSYVKLGDSRAQQCFLHLILCFDFQEHPPNNTKLIESLIDEGLLGGIGTRQELHDQGNTILDKLRKNCLLGVTDLEEDPFLHPLIRNMALHRVRSTTHMVKAYVGLKEIPENKFWTDHLKKVFLQGNNLKKIRDGILPNCPKLTRLSLNDNNFLEAIHESFFRHLKGLKVLDLSHTRLTKLPDTISHLESLEALLLRGCKKLCHIPSVQKLGSLRKLDLSGCAMLEGVPEGIEMLVKLSYLDLCGTKIETLSEGVLGKLVNLQYLVIIKVMTEEIDLTEVEGLYCSVSNVETFNACTRFLEQNSSLQYELWLNESQFDSFWNVHQKHIIIKSCHGIATRVDGEIGGDGCALLPKNVQLLEVGRCNGMTSLCEVGSLDNLEELKIEEWEKLEELGAVHFPQLLRLNITRCSKLKHLLEEGHWLPRLQWFKIEGSEELEWINVVAHFLYSIEVCNCPKMKSMMEWDWLATRLINLRSIKIKNCEKLEEIIGGPGEIEATYCLTKIEIEGCNNLKRVLMRHDMSPDLPFLRHLSVIDCKGIEVIIGIAPNMMQPSFSNLAHLTLSNLPELKGICDGTVSRFSIESINITNCPKLKRLPLLDNGLPYPRTSLGSICIDLLTLQSLEHDCPLFPEFTVSRGVSEWRDRRIRKWIKSCDSIAAWVDVPAGGDGRYRLLKNVIALEEGQGSGVTSLSEVGRPQNLVELTILKWEKLEELGSVHFPHLQKLKIIGFSKLKHLSLEGQGLPRLQWFEILDLKELERIDLAMPDLNHIRVFKCPEMKRVVEWDCLVNRLPNLKSISIFNCEKLEEIIGGSLPIFATCLLTYLEVHSCDNMKGVLLTHDMLLGLPFLQHIVVEDCKGMEVILGTASMITQPYSNNLTHLTLKSLPELKRICDQMESCDGIQFIKISDCPKLKSFPLRLHPLVNGLLSPPPSLGQILIDEETWQAWDRPKERISLEPFIEFI